MRYVPWLTCCSYEWNLFTAAFSDIFGLIARGKSSVSALQCRMPEALTPSLCTGRYQTLHRRQEQSLSFLWKRKQIHFSFLFSSFSLHVSVCVCLFIDGSLVIRIFLSMYILLVSLYRLQYVCHISVHLYNNLQLYLSYHLFICFSGSMYFIYESVHLFIYILLHYMYACQSACM